MTREDNKHVVGVGYCRSYPADRVAERKRQKGLVRSMLDTCISFLSEYEGRTNTFLEYDQAVEHNRIDIADHIVQEHKAIAALIHEMVEDNRKHEETRDDD
tara:strand:+ start:136 stop:438 length:303 start_codon:yes stop_codon:yes gene_type:complete